MSNLSAASLIVAMIALGSSAVTLTQPRGRNEADAQTTSQRIGNAEARAAELKQQVDKLRADFDSHQQFVFPKVEEAYLAAIDKAAHLDPATTKFNRAVTKYGSLMVSCQGVKPYLDGVKVTLHIGNPMSVEFAGLTLGVTWNARFVGDESNSDARLRWIKTHRHQEFTFTNSLEPGRWNEVEFVLPQTRPEQLGYLKVTVETNEASLLVPRKPAK